MDDKKDAQKPGEGALAAATPLAPPPVEPLPVNPPPVAQDAGSEAGQRRERIRTSDLMMSIATIVIALGTIVSAAAIVLQWREMVNGGADTAAIKIAAQKQADAAQQFADTAALINGGIGEAVQKLQAQAQNVESARESSVEASQKSLQVAIDNAQSDLRAYLVTTMYEAAASPACDYAQHHCVAFNYVNVGRTPAIGIEVAAFLNLDLTSGRTLRESDMQKMSVGKYTGLQGSVLGNSGPASRTANEIGPTPQMPCIQQYHGRPCGHSIYGLIRYKDIFGKSHETGFCTYFPGLGGTPRSCPFGNWFDIRPKGYIQDQQ